MNANLTAPPPDAEPQAACARCVTALPAEALFCPGCGLPAGFVPVAVPPAPPRTVARRALGILAGIGGALAAVAGFAAIILWIAGSASGSGGDEGDLRAVAVSADGRLVAAASRQGRLIVWDSATGYPVREMETGDRGVAAFAPSGWTIATGGRTGCAVHLWSAKTGGQMAQLAPADEPDAARTGTLALAFSHDGQFVAGGCQDGSVTLWSVNRGVPVLRVAAQTGEVRSLAFAPDGAALYSGGQDGTVRRWSLPGGEAGPVFTGLKDAATSLALTPDGARQIGATDGVRGDERIIVWDTATAAEFARLSWDRGMAPVALSPDGSLLATSTLGSVALVERANGDVARRLDLPGKGSGMAALAFSPDGQWLVTGGEHRVAVMWNPHSGTLLRRLRP